MVKLQPIHTQQSTTTNTHIHTRKQTNKQIHKTHEIRYILLAVVR
jgi:hypothetical protein